MRSRLRQLIPLLFVLAVILVGCGDNRDLRRICIVHTNDIHGHVTPEQVQGERVGTGGLAVFAAWLEEVRRRNVRAGVPTFLFDAGDIFTGTPEGALGKGREIVRLFNGLGYQAVTVGNHEFDFGYYSLTRMAQAAEFPFLGANISLGEGSPVDFIEPWVVFEEADIKLGVIGVTTDEVPFITLTGNTGKIVFSDPTKAVEAARRSLEAQGVRVILALTHQGLEEDLELAREVKGLDVIIGGHTHTLLEEPMVERGVIVCQAGSYGRWAGKLDLWVDPAAGTVERWEYELFTNLHGAYPPQLETARALRELEKKLDPGYQEVYGLSLSELAGEDDRESVLGDLIADAMREATKTDLAFENPYGIRWPIFPGKITGRAVFLVIPFTDDLVTMELSGRQVRELLEQSFTLHKGMLQVSGLKAEYDLSRPEGSRLLRAWVGEDPLDDKEDYTVTVNGFLAGGGDGFITFRQGRNVRRTGVILRRALQEYIRRHTPLDKGAFPLDRLIDTG